MDSIPQHPPPPEPIQLSLALAIHDVPDVVRDHGLVETHRFPYASHGKPFWNLRRVPTGVAWERYSELELHSATARTVIVLDCDTQPQHYLSVALGATVQTPNWIVSAPSGHAHVVYCLASPVLHTDQAKLQPIVMLGRIAEFYTREYGADTAYAMLLTHNPTHGRYTDSTSWLREKPWRLDELADVIPSGWRIPPRPSTDEGRNCALFRAAMRHFGKPKHWDDSLDLGTVLGWIERTFEGWYPNQRDGWHRNECTWIAKSVTRYCRRNLHSGRTQEQFSLLQAERGRLSGQARRRGTPLEDEPQPWIDLDIPRRTWYRYRGAPPASTTDEAPWLDLGISRATWYRHAGEPPATLIDEAPWTRLGISRATWYRNHRAASTRLRPGEE